MFQIGDRRPRQAGELLQSSSIKAMFQGQSGKVW